jgi:alcohol dehydrogenase class IV
MLNALLSPTRFVSFEEMSPEELAAAALYLGASGGRPVPRRVALVRDARPSAAVDALAAGLAARFELVTLDRVQPNPLAADISAMARDCGLSSVDLVIGLGGGSVMDSAKALAMLAENGGDLEDYLGATPKRKIERKGRPLILVPTTAGTGSEATRVGVYTSGSGRKYTLGSPLLQADAALLSGSLSASMPPSLMASTGFDALSHALESIWNKNATPLSLDASNRAALMVLAALEPAYDASVEAAAGKKPASRNATALAMLEAAAAAGVAFSTTGTALVHALSFVLSEDWHVPHGTACAFTLEDAYRLQCRDPEVARRLAAVGLAAIPGSRPENAAQLLLERILVLKRKMGLPSTFAELGVKLERKEVRARFERAFEDPKMANSLPAARPEEVYAMLEGKA